MSGVTSTDVTPDRVTGSGEPAHQRHDEQPDQQAPPNDPVVADPVVAIESISAITLATHDMGRAVRFYRALGFALHYGGEDAAFTSFSAGPGYLNLVAVSAECELAWWGRVIFHVADVDAVYARAVRRGLDPSFAPRDAEWGERYFHLTDPDGHELSFARPLEAPPPGS